MYSAFRQYASHDSSFYFTVVYCIRVYVVKCLMRSCISFACTALYASLIQDGLKAGDETLMGRCLPSCFCYRLCKKSPRGLVSFQTEGNVFKLEVKRLGLHKIGQYFKANLNKIKLMFDLSGLISLIYASKAPLLGTVTGFQYK